MSDNLGGDTMQFAFAMWDSTKAALVGLNPVPVLVTSLFIGMVQPQRGFYLLKAIIALVPAVFLVAVWPLASGYTPIWPDLTQPETEIQLVLLLLLAWAIIRLMHLVKATMSVSSRHPQPKPNGH
ncbi:MAG: hypothetical protein JF615_04670 [Asticcacaulis sp.]|nr:hypothetical protein [Asticcacaulis sp.]